MSEILEEARAMGWVPEEEWQGDPERWRPAEEFVERGNNILPIVRKQRDELKKELETVIKSQGDQFKKEIAQIKKEVRSTLEKEYEQKLKELSEKEIQAVQDGDVDTYTELQAEKENLKKPAQETEAFVEWKKDNDWWGTDEDLTEFAIGASVTLKEKIDKGEVAPMSELDFYKKVEERVKQTMAHKFTNENREKPNMAEGSTNKETETGKQDWNSLPKSAKETYKKQAAQWESQGRKLDKDSWVRAYYED